MTGRPLIAVASGALSLCLVAGTAAAKPPPSGRSMDGMVMPKDTGDIQLSIVRARKGGYMWSDGKHASATAQVIMCRGHQLILVNRGPANQLLIQSKGPRIALPPPLGRNHGTILVLQNAGIYRFRTKAYVEKPTPGMPKMMRTRPGRPNRLLLIIRVRDRRR